MLSKGCSDTMDINAHDNGGDSASNINSLNDPSLMGGMLSTLISTQRKTFLPFVEAMQSNTFFSLSSHIYQKCWTYQGYIHNTGNFLYKLRTGKNKFKPLM